MNVKELKEVLAQVPEDIKVLAAAHDEHEVFEALKTTVETDMRTGETVLIVVVESDPTSDNARDFEPHPAYEGTVNKWLF